MKSIFRQTPRYAVTALAFAVLNAAGNAQADPLTVPGIRDGASNTVTRITAPATNQTNKVIGPVQNIAPRIGNTNQSVDDSAMFRADSALQGQIASDSAGFISPN